MTNCTRAGGCAGCNYPFLTLKERDNETGLDYFLARYYSSSQGRFTSPDEFSGGPDELYTFSDYASDNPTFYADLRNPQSLNKYQYTYNSPLNLTDNDGHCPECKKVGEKLIQAADAVADAKIGVDKAGINMLIGMNNVSASFGIGDYIEPLQPTSRVQDFAMQETEKITFVASFLGGRGPANVVSAESKTTARVVAETAQVSVAPKIGEVGGGTRWQRSRTFARLVPRHEPNGPLFKGSLAPYVANQHPRCMQVIRMLW